MTLPSIFLELLHLPPEASSASTGIDALHAAVIGIAIVGSVGMSLLVLRSVLRYRRTPETTTTTPRIVSNRVHELGLAGAILTFFLIVWVVGYRQYVDLRTPPPNAMLVYVTAKQWMWKFGYVDGRSSNDDLVVPVGRPVKLVMTSRDVIHSFFVPAFRLKQDVIPGRYVTMWFLPTKVGDYDIFCAEYCGVSHSSMHGTVHVVAADDYARALAAHVEGAKTVDSALEGSAIVARFQCNACHATDERTKLGPSWKNLYGSWQTLADGRRILADDDYLARSILDPDADKVAGFTTLMPSYRAQMTPGEVAAVVAYIRSLGDKTP